MDLLSLYYSLSSFLFSCWFGFDKNTDLHAELALLI